MSDIKCSWCDRNSYECALVLNSGSYPRPMYHTAAICSDCAFQISRQFAFNISYGIDHGIVKGDKMRELENILGAKHL